MAYFCVSEKSVGARPEPRHGDGNLNRGSESAASAFTFGLNQNKWIVSNSYLSKNPISLLPHVKKVAPVGVRACLAAEVRRDELFEWSGKSDLWTLSQEF